MLKIMHSVPLTILFLHLTGCIAARAPTLHQIDLNTPETPELSDIVLTKRVHLEPREKERTFYLSEKHIEEKGGSEFGGEQQVADVGCIIKGLRDVSVRSTIIEPPEFWRRFSHDTATIQLTSLFDEPYSSAIKPLDLDYLVVVYHEIFKSKSAFLEYGVEGLYSYEKTEVAAATILDMHDLNVIGAFEVDGHYSHGVAHMIFVVPLILGESPDKKPCQLAGQRVAEVIRASSGAIKAPRIALVAAKNNPYRALNDPMLFGDAETQYVAATTMGDVDPERRLRLLCRAADKGYSPARNLLGVYYEYGTNGLDKDLLRAYLWYRLASTHRNTLAAQLPIDRVEGYLTDAGLAEAETMFENWKPGQCEKDLSITMRKDN